MKRLSIVWLFVFCTTLSLFAQNGPELIREDIHRAGANHYTYHVNATGDTAPPRGYKPLYVSHYGRHGSRYLSEDDSYRYVISVLERLGRDSLLTKRGEDLLAQTRELMHLEEPSLGLLSPLGAQEHHDIAVRMVSRYAPLLDGTATIRMRSTDRPRCHQSMEAAAGGFMDVNPALVIDADGGKSYMYYLLDKGDLRHKKLVQRHLDSLRHDGWNPEKIIAPLVKDLPAALGTMKDPVRFEWMLMEAGINCQCIPTDIDLLRDYIPYDEAVKGWSMRNRQIYLYHANSREFGAMRLPSTRPLLRDFLAKADSALAYGGVAVDMRFGHDAGLMPLLALIGVGSYAPQLSSEQTDQWLGFSQMCMGTNLQMAFYRNRRGKILVKLLLNEGETSIPALGPGPWYPWPTLRSYLASLL